MTIKLQLAGHEQDLGGFSVRRLLPHRTLRSLGPFVFFDHMGPAEFPPGRGITVRPHPHIHLATVTYLFEGAIQHRDSLGNDERIEPGAINWMTAGHGIVHSERAPAELLRSGGRLHGIQLWVALPAESQDCPPSFSHHAGASLPEFREGRATIRLLLGHFLGRESPVPLLSDLYYLDVSLPQGASLRLPPDARESALYGVQGALRAGDATVPSHSLAVRDGASELTLTAQGADARFVLLGGTSLGKRFMDWNFISSEARHIEEAKREWAKGPGTARFPKVPGDDQDFIPLPSLQPPHGDSG